MRTYAGKRNAPAPDPPLPSVRPRVEAVGARRAQAQGEPSRFVHDFSRVPVSASARPTLRVSPPGDARERQAEQVAGEVTRPFRRPFRPPHPSEHAGGTEGGGAEAPDIVHQVLRSPGQPLDGATRARMEARLGHDFSHVRVHADARAQASAQAVGALAYAVGSHVVFGEGQYAPGTGGTQRLVAHELAHVVQAGGAAETVYRQQRTGTDARSLAVIVRRMGAAVNLLQGQRRREMLGSIQAILGAFIPQGYGTKDSAGAVTRPSAVAPIEVPLSGGRRYRHDVRLFISDEVPATPLMGEYVGGRGGGVITIYSRSLVGADQAAVADVLLHETVHLYNDVVANAQRGPVPVQPGTGSGTGTGAGAAQAPRSPVSVGDVRHFDITLGAGRSSSSPHQSAITTAFEPLVEFLNRSRIGRGQPRLGDPNIIASGWARSAADEIMAFQFTEPAVAAVHRAGRSGGARVSMGLTPEVFVTSYARDLWLRDPQDRAALRTREGRAVLDQVSRSPHFVALFAEVERWLDAPPPQAPPSRARGR
ncbi:MAG TPA: DUF4157 domain-containing protein [Longimicrobium sp.]